MMTFEFSDFCWKTTHIAVCREETHLGTSQIEDNESSHFCFPVVPTDRNLNRSLSHMLLRNTANA